MSKLDSWKRSMQGSAESPLVSVIVPIYNVSAYLDRCIESIAQQSYGNLEILLIDDGSTDGSDSICQKWRAKDNRIIYHRKENEGLGPARNTGIRMANGEYLSGVDADDFVDRDYIMRLTEAATKNDADLAVCNYFHYEERKEEKIYGCKYAAGYRIIETYEEKLRYMKGIPRASFWGKLYRRKYLIDNALFQPATTAQDVAVEAATIACANRIVETASMLYYYRVSNSQSITVTKNKLKDFPRIFSYSVNEMERLGLFERYQDGLAAILWFHASCMLKRYTHGPERETEAAELEALFDSRFPGRRKNLGKKWFVYGSYNAEWTAQLCSGSILCTKKQIAFSSLICQFLNMGSPSLEKIAHPNPVRKRMVEADLFPDLSSYAPDEEEAVMIDFSAETTDILITDKNRYITDSEAFREADVSGISVRERLRFASEGYMELWYRACDAFAKWIGERKKMPVYLLHMELPELDGTNKIIECMEQYFMARCPECACIRADSSLYYTQEAHPFGEKPENLNWDLYREFAAQICKW